jgi:predicted ribosomally synthesized peptide with SipW-like signal peptide
MSDNDDDSGKVTLSRRKALAGIGSIGAATALGGIGTYAQFTDVEEDSVTFTAGGIDGVVRYGASYNGNDVKTHGGDSFAAELENVEKTGSGVGLNFSFTDIKPGDWGCFSFGIEVENNPAWVAACIGYENDSDNQIWEEEVGPDGDLSYGDDVPVVSGGTKTIERNPDEPGPLIENAQTNGELPHEMLFIPFYAGQNLSEDGGTFDPCIFFDPSENEFSIDDYEGTEANDVSISTPLPFWSNADNELRPATLLQVLQQSYVDSANWGGDGSGPHEVEIVNPPGVAEGCVFLNGKDSNSNKQEAAPIEPGTEFEFGWDWHLPFDVGDELQGDSMNLKLGFTFSQVRHTEEATLNNVFYPGGNTPN